MMGGFIDGANLTPLVSMVVTDQPCISSGMFSLFSSSLSILILFWNSQIHDLCGINFPRWVSLSPSGVISLDEKIMMEMKSNLQLQSYGTPRPMLDIDVDLQICVQQTPTATSDYCKTRRQFIDDMPTLPDSRSTGIAIGSFNAKIALAGDYS